MPGKLWTDNEIALLRENYPNKPTKEVVNMLPGRTKPAVYYKAMTLGLAKNSLAWTDEEDEILKEHYSDNTADEIQKNYLPHKTKHAIYHRVRQLNLQKEPDNWKPPDKDKFIALYNSGLSPHKMAVEYGISRRAIRNKIKEYGIEKRTKEEQQSLSNIDLSKWSNNGDGWTPTLNKALFYILGVLKGDGFISVTTVNNCTQYKIGLSVCDKSFVEEFVNALREIGLSHSGRIFGYSQAANRSKVYKTHAECKIFVDWYKKVDLSWIKNNTTKPEHKISFIKGIYESEGSLLNNNGYRCIEIVNTNHSLMQLTKQFMEDFCHPTLRAAKRKKTKNRRNHKTVYKIGLYRDKQVKRMIELMEPCIERKRRLNVCT